MIINQFDHDHCNDHEYRDDGESGGKSTHCQEGGGEGQGAGSKNLKKEKFKIRFIHAMIRGKIFLIILIMIPKDQIYKIGTRHSCHLVIPNDNMT